MPPTTLASALTPNTNNYNKNGVYRTTIGFVKLPILSYCPVMYDIVKIFQIVRFLLDIFQYYRVSTSWVLVSTIFHGYFNLTTKTPNALLGLEQYEEILIT